MGKRLLFAATAVLLLAVGGSTAFAQGTRELTGKVMQVGGGPIADATVTLVGAPVGTRTNDAGEFRLRVPQGNVTVLARAFGFRRQSQAVPAGQNSVTFNLEKDVLQLEGVVVTGQATTIDKSNATTAVSTISVQELTRVPARSIEGSLAGKASGVQIFDNSGAPGGGSQIRIRGATSILGQSDPLYVIDGVIVSNAAVPGGLNAVTRAGGGIGGAQDAVVNRLADINPNDIESVEVLKSAAASAIYGSRATNGVVVITTKKGRTGQTRYSITQRLGTQQLTRALGYRRYATYDDVKDWTNGGPEADARAREACAPNCTNYDWEEQMYGRTDPTWETVLTASGGVNNTRFYASVSDKQESGIMLNTGGRRTSGRMNLDQSIGDKLTISGGLGITRNFLQRGVSNNDNSGISPVYLWGYTPHIIDLRKRDASGNFVTMPFNGGGSNVSNPFQTMAYLKNDEQVWRQTGNMRLSYALYSRDKQSVQLSYLAGVDRFQQENTVYSPNFLQFEPKDGFLGTSTVANTSSWQFNQSVNAVWGYTPAQFWLGSLTTSLGIGSEEQDVFTYRIQGRGLIPTVPRADGGAQTTVENPRTTFRDQAYYLNTQALLLDDKLTLQAGVRGDRSSANGDREKFYTFPKFSAAYRLVNPRWLGGYVDELKFRLADGRSGNRPRFGDRDVLYAAGGIIGGNSSLVSAGLLGNSKIKPESMHEQEYGLDAVFLRQRFGFEVTNYRRTIEDMLLTFPLPPSSGLGNQIINGGQLSVKGWELGFNTVPYTSRDFTWTSRVTTSFNEQVVDFIPVPAFAVLGSFGATYGRNRIVSGQRSTWVWANAPLGVDGAVRDTIIGDSNPIHNTQFTNEFTWKSWSLSTLLDWRNGGLVSDMTWNLYDEGGQSHDFDSASPDASMSLGEYRYDKFGNGDSRTYIEPGTYVKLREVTLTWQAPASIASKLGGRARDLRVSLSGRNLAMWSKYWAYDPEFNNFGNTNFNRFIDLAPFPSSRQLFLSVDVGF